MLGDGPEDAKNLIDILAATNMLAVVFSLMPHMAAALTVAWFVVRLYGGIVKELHMRKIRKLELARMEREARE